MLKVLAFANFQFYRYPGSFEGFGPLVNAIYQEIQMHEHNSNQLLTTVITVVLCFEKLGRTSNTRINTVVINNRLGEH